VIVFRGAGGAADVLANSLEFLTVKANELPHCNSPCTDQFCFTKQIYNQLRTPEMMEILEKSFVERMRVAEVKKWIDVIKKIFLMRKHITILGLKQKKELSQVLMENVHKNDSVPRLFIAMQMNSTSDVKAQLSKINLEGYEALFTSASAYEVFFDAIAKNNTEIVSIFLEQGIKLSVSKEMDTKILKFFNRIPDWIRTKILGGRKFEDLLDSEKYAEFTVSELIDGLRYLKKRYIGSYHYDDYGDDSDPGIHGQLHPVEALFFWSLATENFEMAEIFWRESEKSALVMALVGAAACNFNFKLKSMYDTENRTVLTRYKKKFSDLAIGLLNESIKGDIINHHNTKQFLTKIHPEYGLLTPLEIALNGNVAALIANDFIQDELETIWLGRISKRISKWPFKYGLHRELVYYVTLLFPFAAPFWLEFDVKCPASYLTKLLCFFNAPRTVYVYNFILYTIYQGLFGYVLTMQFCTRPFFAEWVLLGWTITLVLEEFRQIANSGKD
jgi:hypothetical protein